MEPKYYAAAIWRRAAWVLATGLFCATAAAGLALTSPVSYTATSSVYIGVREVTSAEGLASGSRLGEHIVPSVVRLATTAAVLAPVIEELGLDGTPQDVAATLEVELVEDTSVVIVSARAGSPSRAAAVAEAVADQLQVAASTVYADGDGTSLLRVETVDPAAEPRFRTTPNLRQDAVLGLGVGLLAGVVLSGLRELARPRVRDAADVARVTPIPLLATLPADRAGSLGSADRTAAVDRLQWLLHTGHPARAADRLVLLGTRRGATDRLTADLTASGTKFAVTPVADAAALATAGLRPDDVLLVVTDGRRATRRELERATAAAGASAAEVAGVVLDGGLPAGAGWRPLVRAALRGDAPLPLLAGRSVGSVRALGTLPTSSAVTAAVALFAVGLAFPLPAATTTALVAGIALIPVWITAVPRFRGGVPLFALTAIGLVSGLMLAGWTAADHEFAARPATEISFLVLTALTTIGLLLWARSVLPLPAIGVAYGLGLLVTGILDVPASVNAYKFELSLPLTIIVLALVSTRRSRLLTVVALAVLGLADIANDARSAFAFCVIAAGLVLWQGRPERWRGRTGRGASVLLLGATAVGVYLAVSQLLVSGALGEEVQARSTTQIEQSGSLLLGGRPEWTATWALMQERPLGFGLGIVPNSGDVSTAKGGFTVTNIPTATGYIENYMLDSRFELHSIVADLWAGLGPAGLALGLTMAVLLGSSLTSLLSRRTASGLACFLALTSIWYLAFGTLPSNLLDVAVGLGLLLLPRTGPERDGGPAAAARAEAPDRVAAPSPASVR